MLIINTKKGEEIYNKVKQDIITKDRNIEEAFARNPQLKHPILLKKDEREEFWKTYKNGGIKVIAKKYGKYTNIGKIKNIVKKYIGR